MHRMFAGTTTAAFILALGAPAFAKVETVKGQLVDKACYERNNKNNGQKHVDRPIDECATACAKYPLPLAVLTADGKVYQIVGELAKTKNAKLVPHLTHIIEVTGDVTTDEEGTMKIAGTDLKMVSK